MVPNTEFQALSIKHPITITLFSAMRDYYEENWKTYHEATVAIDPAPFLAPLFARIAPPATILDVGCGSGRDLLWFTKRGFRVTGFERSPSLAELARKHSGCPVIEGDFEVYDFSDQSADAPCSGGSSGPYIA